MSDDLSRCPECKTPVAIWKGSVWQWACRECIERRIGIDGPAVVYTSESK